MKPGAMEMTPVASFKTVKRPIGNINKNEGQGNHDNKKDKTKPKLTLETLQRLTPFHGDIDKVTEAARSLLMNKIRIDPSVHKVFFSDTDEEPRLMDEGMLGFPLEKLAVAIMAEAIAKSNDKYKFHCTIDQDKMESALCDVYRSVHWKKLGFSLYTKLYPTVVRDGKSNICIQDYIEDDGPAWAERIIETMTEPSWVMSWMKKIVRGQVTAEEYNREMNALFVKLHLLDPQSVIPTYHLLNNMRALPDCNLELATHNYLGGPLDSDMFSKEVRQAIHKESCPLHVSKLSLDDIDLYYGVEVEEFLFCYIREYGMWNGRRPHNKVESKLKDRCSIM